MNFHSAHIIRYHNPAFNETAMHRKIVKNMAVGFTYQTLYMALKEELEKVTRFLAFYPDDPMHHRRRLELEDQMLYMMDHASQYGASLVGL